MRPIAGLVGLLAGLVACGGPTWKGIYDGNETSAGTCSDGSGGSQSDSSVLDIGDDDNGIFWPLACGIALHATVKNNVATIVPASCGAATSGGLTTITQVTGGTLTINGDSITENITATVSTLDGGTRCNDTLTGTFTRQN
jgi:hypothetical protein